MAEEVEENKVAPLLVGAMTFESFEKNSLRAIYTMKPTDHQWTVNGRQIEVSELRFDRWYREGSLGNPEKIVVAITTEAGWEKHHDQLFNRIEDLEKEVEGLRTELREIYNSETKAVTKRLQSEV